MARSIGGDEKGAKQNGGAVGLFGDVEALQGSGVVFVTEGWADALSIVEAGKENGEEYHAVALNGAANGRKLIEAAADFSGVFVLALDNDDAGRKASENLSAMMQEAGFPFSVADLCGGCKDENEFLVMDRAGFSFACLEAYETAQAAAEKAARPDSIDAYITGGGWREDVERGAENRESTGFLALDGWLGGGLYEGLTVISGLQLSAVYSKEYRDAGKERTGGKEKQASIVERAKKETPRRVSLVGLKNRRGAMSGRIDFLFDARHCKFTEAIGVEDETLSARDVEDLLQF